MRPLADIKSFEDAVEYACFLVTESKSHMRQNVKGGLAFFELVRRLRHDKFVASMPLPQKDQLEKKRTLVLIPTASNLKLALWAAFIETEVKHYYNASAPVPKGVLTKVSQP